MTYCALVIDKEDSFPHYRFAKASRAMYLAPARGEHKVHSGNVLKFIIVARWQRIVVSLETDRSAGGNKVLSQLGPGPANAGTSPSL